MRVFSVVAHECDSSVVECGSELGAGRDLVSASADGLVAVDCICFTRLVFDCRGCSEKYLMEVILTWDLGQDIPLKQTGV